MALLLAAHPHLAWLAWAVLSFGVTALLQRGTGVDTWLRTRTPRLWALLELVRGFGFSAGTIARALWLLAVGREPPWAPLDPSPLPSPVPLPLPPPLPTRTEPVTDAQAPVSVTGRRA